MSDSLYGKDGLLDRFTVAAQGIHRIAQECRVVMAQQRGRAVPELPEGASLFAVNCKTGQWYYVNHADTWQGMPNPLPNIRKDTPNVR